MECVFGTQTREREREREIKWIQNRLSSFSFRSFQNHLSPLIVIMSDDERGSDFEASDEEGENQIVHQFDDDDDDTEIEDNEDDDDQTREEKLKMRLSKMIWSDKMEQLKKRNKDKVLSKKVLFKPANVIDCFGRFMPTKLKEKIRQYSNMKGMCDSLST